MRHLRFPVIFLGLVLLLSFPAHRARALDLLIDVLAAGVTDSTGVPVSLGSVTFYDAGTTNLRTVYLDFAMGSPAANPLTLDSAGRAIVYTNLRVKLVIKDADGNAVRTIDNVGSTDADVATAAAAGGLQIVIPTGVIMAYGGNASAPSGWLYCDGTAYSQIQYAALYAVIGTAYNTGGEASGYFRVPNTSRRALIGAGGSATATCSHGTDCAGVGIFNTVGSRGGEEKHTLTIAEVPAHAISAAKSLFGLDIVSGTESAFHHHNITIQDSRGSAGGTASMSNNTGGTAAQNTDNESATHTHTITAADLNNSQATHTHTTDGGGGTHNTIQPSLVANYIIKY